METFRQFLAFPMFATAAWLIWVVSQQAGPMGVLGGLMGLVLIAFAFWLLGHTPQKTFWRIKLRVLALTALGMAFVLAPATQMDMPQSATPAYTFGEPFTPQKLNEALRGPNPVFVEMTAAWCISCKVNHAVAINTDATKALFEKYNVRYLIGDWTNKDPVITEYLKSFGRNGVPIYIYYGPPDAAGKRPAPLMLPQILTTGIVADAVTP
jgi:thiol:disulfide interchange protein DsbD